MVLPSDMKPTWRGDVHRIVHPFFYSRMPPRKFCGRALFSEWIPVDLRKTFLEVDLFK